MTRDEDVQAVQAEISPTGIVRDEHGHPVPDRGYHFPYDADPFTVAEFDEQTAQTDAADWERGR